MSVAPNSRAKADITDGPFRVIIHSPRGISLNLSDLGHVPATAIIAEPFPSALRDRDGVLEFDEPALRM
jgi:hypothetical protein